MTIRILNFPAVILVAMSGWLFLQSQNIEVSEGSPTPPDEVVFRTYGVKINVTDLDKAVQFYCDKLGFTIEKRIDDSHVSLATGEPTRLILHKVALLPPSGEWESRAGLILQINNLDSTISKLTAIGIDLSGVPIRKEGVGNAITLTDPFGNRLSLMHQTVVPLKPFKEPRIYNYGFLISDMEKARDFYCRNLGFVVRSEKYLPLDLPLGHSDNTFAFMLHYRDGVVPVRFNVSDNERIVIMFQTSNLEEAIRVLKEKGVKFQQQRVVEGKIGRHIAFYDPFGYLSELVEIK